MELWDAKAGDLGIMIRGVVKNEYDEDKWICLRALAYNSTNIVGGILDQGHICGAIRVYVKAGEAEQFQMHLKYREDIKRIEILCGCISEIMPP